MADFEPYAAVYCRVGGCGLVDMDKAEYQRQMAKPSARWTCPQCGGLARWDDARFEELHPAPDAGGDA